MTRIANTCKRAPYRSDLREEQARATRDRILDAVVRVMARGVAELSMPAVAREAGVSVPTVYRHFGSKPQLLAEVQPYFARRAGLGQLVPPRSLDDLHRQIAMVFARIDELGDLGYAALASPLGRKARQLRMDERVRAFRAALEAIGPGLSADERERLTRVLLVLTSSASLRTWRDSLEVAPQEAADDVAWVVRAALAGAGGANR